MNSRNCVVCNIDVHRASYVKQLRSKKILGKYKTKVNDYTRMVI